MLVVDVECPVNKAPLSKFIQVERKKREIDREIIVNLLYSVFALANNLGCHDLADCTDCRCAWAAADTVRVAMKAMEADQLYVQQPIQHVAQRLEKRQTGN